MEETYGSWDELVKARANGWVAIAIITSGNSTWPWVCGPFVNKQVASNARARLRNRFKRSIRNHELNPNATASFYVRPLWKSTD